MSGYIIMSGGSRVRDRKAQEGPLRPLS